jgi:hypothetical protein
MVSDWTPTLAALTLVAVRTPLVVTLCFGAVLACASDEASGRPWRSGEAAGTTPLPTRPTQVEKDRTAASWLPDRDTLRQVPRPLLSMLEEDPYSYFRYVNRPWARRVCDSFQADIPTLPRVRVHGDAHVEQYAFTGDEFGLDDFDDSAEGPSVVDLTRFVGSLELAARRRGWTTSLEGVIAEFFRGYEVALVRPAYRPPTPAIVTRRRGSTARTRDEFLAWTDSLMQPVSTDIEETTRTSLRAVAGLVAASRPGTSVEQFALKKVGRIQLGIGSLLTPKLLVRTEGPTDVPGDDLVLEVKALSDLSSIECLTVPDVQEGLRVVLGSQQIGRLKHDVLSIVPVRLTPDPAAREWWIRTWNLTYGEIDVDHFASVDELREVAHDAGAQLGSTNLPATSAGAERRARERQTFARMRPRIRNLARELSRDVVEAWERLRQ